MFAQCLDQTRAVTALMLASWLCEIDIVIDIEHGKTVIIAKKLSEI